MDSIRIRRLVTGAVCGGLLGLTPLLADDNPKSQTPSRPSLSQLRGSDSGQRGTSSGPSRGTSNNPGSSSSSGSPGSARSLPQRSADDARSTLPGALRGQSNRPERSSGSSSDGRLPIPGPNLPSNKNTISSPPSLPNRPSTRSGETPPATGNRSNILNENTVRSLPQLPRHTQPNTPPSTPGNRLGGASSPSLGSDRLPNVKSPSLPSDTSRQGSLGSSVRDRLGPTLPNVRGQSDNVGTTRENRPQTGAPGRLPGVDTGRLPNVKGTETPRPRDATRLSDKLPQLELDPKVKERLERSKQRLSQDERPLIGPGDRGPGTSGGRDARPFDPNVKGPLNPNLGTDRLGSGRLGTERLGTDRLSADLLGPARLDPQRKVIRTRLDKDGLLGDPRLTEELNRLKNVRKPDEVQNFFTRIKNAPEFQNTRLAHINVDHLTGNFQQNLLAGHFQRITQTNLAANIHLGDQYNLFVSGGDVARQLNLHQTLVAHGGWRHRYVGPVYVNYTRAAFSAWYPGPAFYPPYCWTPIWSPWVRWCFWDWCWPIFDPRPWICRPIIYPPCPPIVIYEYPVFTPLPVVACGTWVDFEPVIVDTGFDLQLVAVRFVDPGHPDQDLGPRYRVWIANNSASAIGAPFNVTLVAANGPTLTAGNILQAGVSIPSMDARETVPVDIRLPAASNRMGSTPDGHRIPFSHLHVLVDSHRDLAEVNEANNGAVIPRGEILPVDPAAFSTDVTAAAPGTLVSLAGEGFGPEPGQLIVVVDSLQQQAEIHGWYDLGVYFKLPAVNLAGPTSAEILVVRGDGAASNPVTLTLAPDQVLTEAPLPPLPMP